MAAKMWFGSVPEMPYDLVAVCGIFCRAALRDIWAAPGLLSEIKGDDWYEKNWQWV